MFKIPNFIIEDRFQGLSDQKITFDEKFFNDVHIFGYSVSDVHYLVFTKQGNVDYGYGATAEEGVNELFSKLIKEYVANNSILACDIETMNNVMKLDNNTDLFEYAIDEWTCEDEEYAEEFGTVLLLEHNNLYALVSKDEKILVTFDKEFAKTSFDQTISEIEREISEEDQQLKSLDTVLEKIKSK